MATVSENKIKSEASPPGKSNEQAGVSSLALAMSLLVGTYFGIVLTKSEVVRWQRVHDMFLFKEAHMYLIIGVGVVVAMISMLIIKSQRAKTIEGEPIVYKPKPFHKGVVIGGMLFGAGWAITGACPGPIYAQIGAGAWLGWVTLAGAMIGMYLYAMLKSKLPH
ncbi:DUF6691 family protein [Mariniblastus fucicola]|uniref:Putative inner membrane protein n=1 Tax=Mariniblastus fucicola TaxID=980251 RepID=A0A5B9PN93_9BACT|nr:DUF6691 family protein [Mariniblastus fucicola]QEG23733.1 putative inner membrane protein [Mariniblastus fucicola]